MGPRKVTSTKKSASGGKVIGPGSASKHGRESRRGAPRSQARMSRWPCKDYLGGTCNNSFCEKWHPPGCLYYKTKSGGRFGEKCSFAHRQVDEQPTKRSKSNNDKSAVALLKKGNWQERKFVSDACHDRTGQLVKRSDKKLLQKFIYLNVDFLMHDKWVSYFRT